MKIYGNNGLYVNGKKHRYSFKEYLTGLGFLILFGTTIFLMVPGILIVPLIPILLYIQYRFQTRDVGATEDMTGFDRFQERMWFLIYIGSGVLGWFLIPSLFMVRRFFFASVIFCAWNVAKTGLYFLRKFQPARFEP